MRHKHTNKEYALKYIDKTKCIQRKAVNNVIGERRLLERINHPLIVNLRYAFQDDDTLYMALDLMLGGDLRFLLEREKRLSELQVRFYVAEISLSLSYLHRRRIAHRDIKPDNILLDDQGHAHLSDFNVAAIFTDKRPLRYSSAGTTAYMAPEILSKQGYSTTVDWWSLGVSAYELLFGERPFHGKTAEEYTDAVLHQPLRFPLNAYELVSDDCIQFLSGVKKKIQLLVLYTRTNFLYSSLFVAARKVAKPQARMRTRGTRRYTVTQLVSRHGLDSAGTQTIRPAVQARCKKECRE